jgi:hypothetical protein
VNESREKVRYQVTSVALPPGGTDAKSVDVVAVCTNSPAAPKWLPRTLEFEVSGEHGMPRRLPQVTGYVEASFDLYPDESRIGYDQEIRETLAKHGVPGANVDEAATEVLRVLTRAGALR